MRQCNVCSAVQDMMCIVQSTKNSKNDSVPQFTAMFPSLIIIQKIKKKVYAETQFQLRISGS